MAIGILFLATDRARASTLQPTSESVSIEQIQRYCTVSWRNASIPRAEWADCSQQVFLELLQRLPPARWSKAISGIRNAERRELNRAIWRIIKRHVRAANRTVAVPIRGDERQKNQAKDVDDLLDEVMDVAERTLSARQLCIMKMAAAGSAIGEIAEHLGCVGARVSDEKYRTVLRLREVFASNGCR
jgi:hypothetical protein